MNNITNKLKKNSSYRKVFSKTRKSDPRTKIRLAVESLILLVIGILLYLLLQSIALQNDVLNLLSVTLSNYYEALKILFTAFKSTISILLVLLLAFFCIIIFLSSFWRLVRLISIHTSKGLKQKKF